MQVSTRLDEDSKNVLHERNFADRETAEAAERFKTLGRGRAGSPRQAHTLTQMSFAQVVSTSKPLCNLNSVQCSGNQFETMHK